MIPSQMGTWINHIQTQHEIDMRRDQFWGYAPELPILHEMLIYQGISINLSDVPTW